MSCFVVDICKFIDIFFEFWISSTWLVCWYHFGGWVLGILVSISARQTKYFVCKIYLHLDWNKFQVCSFFRIPVRPAFINPTGPGMTTERSFSPIVFRYFILCKISQEKKCHLNQKLTLTKIVSFAANHSIMISIFILVLVNSRLVPGGPVWSVGLLIPDWLYKRDRA